MTTDVLALTSSISLKGRADSLAFFNARMMRGPKMETDMTETHSKSRQQAEIAFGQTQSQLFARGHAVEEIDSIVQAREEKTLRLREARLAKEAQDIAAAASGLMAKRAHKR